VRWSKLPDLTVGIDLFDSSGTLSEGEIVVVLLRNIRRINMPVFTLHRVSAVGAILYIISRIFLVAALKLRWTSGLGSAPYFLQITILVMNALLLACVIYHAVNGIRLALADIFFSRWYEIDLMKRANMITLLLTLIIWILAVYSMTINLVRAAPGGA
jgi:succinate dehydrogenase/fumarate reductase cytochrome b subunit